MILDLVNDFLSGRGANVRLRTRAETLGDLGAHLHDAFGLRHGEGLRVGVGDDEIDALQTGGDHVVDGIAARAADTEHGDAGPQLANIRGGEIDGHGCLSITRAWGLGCTPKRLMEWSDPVLRSSEALSKPSSDLSEVAVGPCHDLPRMPRFNVFKVCELRIHQQAGRHCE